MNFDEYQRLARTTAVYPDIGKNLNYPTLGLCGESGEVAEKVKKLFRDNGGVINSEFTENVKKELGDVLWYVSNIASELNLSLDDIADNNIKKLQSRKERNKLHGYGDNR